MIKKILLLISIMVSISVAGLAGDIVPWDKAAEHYGKVCTVEGNIVSSYNSGKACFLNFHPDYKNHFSVVIFGADFGQFPSSPESYYLNKKVQVTGKIVEYKGHPEIIVAAPSQIKILETQAIDKVSATISWEEADKYYDKEVTVEGKIAYTFNSGSNCFLNFHKNWTKYLFAVIYPGNRAKFPRDPEKYYLNKKVRITGVIRKYITESINEDNKKVQNIAPEIILDSPAQIIVIE